MREHADHLKTTETKDAQTKRSKAETKKGMKQRRKTLTTSKEEGGDDGEEELGHWS
jgi:hypothetical protein